ncbi:hypothetical protein J1605_010232 [Eschrichtius robustus]|uniref:Uncharacterized protein n=1 Tax=Eschrichtius robustus TaxID=9764 RepID=A0AB34GQ98_ESCRO|nr:hypothetical protein J1605_010232 [Eschrichtius robustus]
MVYSSILIGLFPLSGLVPLHNACSYGHYEVTELLLKILNIYTSTIISLTDEFKGHSLLQAAREADLAKVKKTLALEIINFKQPQSHETALHCAVASLHPKRKQVTELLLRKGANVNEKNKDFMTPLHVAAERAHNDVMEVLHKHGAKYILINKVAIHQWGMYNFNRPASDVECLLD